LQIAETLKQAVTELQHFDTAKLDAEVLLSHCLCCDRSYFYAHPEVEIETAQYNQFQDLIKQRAIGRPVAYLVGRKEFWSLEFLVSPDTLIPRPETECLVEMALAKINRDDHYHILDLGTGTGAIAISIAKERQNITIMATDKNEAALIIAKKNASRLDVNNIFFQQAVWFDFKTDQQFDFILSNPPYIDINDPNLQTGDIRFENRQALIAEDNGLADLKTIIRESVHYLKASGWVMLEHGYEQGEAVRQFFCQYSFQNIETINDYAGHERITIAQHIN